MIHEEYVKLVASVAEVIHAANAKARQLGYERSVLQDYENLMVCESLAYGHYATGDDTPYDPEELLDALVGSGFSTPDHIYDYQYDHLYDEVLHALEATGYITSEGDDE